MRILVVLCLATGLLASFFSPGPAQPISEWDISDESKTMISRSWFVGIFQRLNWHFHEKMGMDELEHSRDLVTWAQIGNDLHISFVGFTQAHCSNLHEHHDKYELFETVFQLKADWIKANIDDQDFHPRLKTMLKKIAYVIFLSTENIIMSPSLHKSIPPKYPSIFTDAQSNILQDLRHYALRYQTSINKEAYPILVQLIASMVDVEQKSFRKLFCDILSQEEEFQTLDRNVCAIAQLIDRIVTLEVVPKNLLPTLEYFA